ncbi:GNAT family N-acetyltransferase [Candidatus Woesearchaeota archaeon]|nr:GNAT family N-acetyltransferase [Candidatus Woesearchaeota archaeon]
MQQVVFLFFYDTFINHFSLGFYMKIRKASKSDAKACLQVFKLDKEKYWKLKDFEDAAAHKDSIFLVAEEDNKVVGYVIGYIVPTRKIEAALHETRVDKRERGKHIGAKLVDAFCREAFRRGVKSVFALIEPELAGFYCTKCKFRKTGKWIEVTKIEK